MEIITNYSQINKEFLDQKYKKKQKKTIMPDSNTPKSFIS
jgi:hypothetical protein